MDIDNLLELLDNKIELAQTTIKIIAAGFKVGQNVAWGPTTSSKGIIKAIYKRNVTKKLGGVTVTQLGSPENPALLISGNSGQMLLMPYSQVSPSN